MRTAIGMDIGSVSINVAVLSDEPIPDITTDGHFTLHAGPENTGGEYVYLSRYARIRGLPVNAFRDSLARIRAAAGIETCPLTVTGSAARLIAERFSVPKVNEFSAIVEAVNHLYPDTGTVFEMGGENSKCILLGRNEPDAPLSIVDYGTNGDCAAGTGSFIDQQAGRLKYSIEEVSDLVMGADKAAQVAGRCSVFAKSDMIHAQQRGYGPDEVLKGLTVAVARNFKGAIVRAMRVTPPVLFIGGVAQNDGMTAALREVFDLDGTEIVVPDAMCWMGAVGSAYRARAAAATVPLAPIIGGDAHGDTHFPVEQPLSMESVTPLRDRAAAPLEVTPGERIPVYLGIDIGSVSTNFALIDEEGTVLREIYTQTKARPIEVVSEGLQQLYRDVGAGIEVKGVGTTGSGRELIGILIGADIIKNEITAHKTGALHISRRYLEREVDTIFEIGGQDSKFISIEDGIVVDFTMNDACAAGTGSFLEEQAQDLDVSIVDEFADLAMSSASPLRLGERCTVFMGKDVYSCVQRGADTPDILAGLAYSVVHNYLNRVVGDRNIGDTIFFQGGTAYNDAVAAAFARVTGKEIIIPPHNGVMGAIGAALLAQQKMCALGEPSSFRGFDVSEIDYHLREFVCRGCTNYCTIQEFTVAGEKTYWGDKCSEKYRKHKKVEREPVIGDLYEIRSRLLFGPGGSSADGPTVGIPLCLYSWERLPLFRTYLEECGFRTVVSEETQRSTADKGIEAVVAEPCYPVTVAHGHVQSLLEKSVDYLWLPNIINSETEFPDQESYVCVWGSTLPFVVGHCPPFKDSRTPFLVPTLRFRDGDDVVKRELYECMKDAGVSRARSNAAYDAAVKAQREFRDRLREAGSRALGDLARHNERGVVLVGRPYNIYDRSINLSVASKLASIYGINVIPMDFLPLEDVGIDHINPNMYWNYGRKIIQAAVYLARRDHLDIIYITNFKCGPDSYVKQYVRRALGRPFLVLQFDGHSNDAGMMTRCEAYLDSKGFLDRWEERVHV